MSPFYFHTLRLSDLPFNTSAMCDFLHSHLHAASQPAGSSPEPSRRWFRASGASEQISREEARLGGRQGRGWWWGEGLCDETRSWLSCEQPDGWSPSPEPQPLQTQPLRCAALRCVALRCVALFLLFLFVYLFILF